MGTGALATAAGLGLMGYGAHKMYKGRAGGESPDESLTRSGSRTMKSGAWMTAGGTAALGAAATGFQNLAHSGAAATASTALGTMSMGFMIAGGAVTAARGIWKFGKAAGKLMSLNDVRAVTPRGQAWLARAKDREKAKMKISAFKTVLGAAGIAAGALLLASNPIGWAIGLGAAVVGGVSLAVTLANKYRQKQADDKMKAEMQKQQKENANKVDHEKVTPATQAKVAQATDEAAAAISSNLEMGFQIKEALLAADHRYAEPVYGRAAEKDAWWGEGVPFPTVSATMLRLQQISKAPTPPEFTALDAVMILSALNLDRNEAIGAEGPQLIQDKLSAAAAG